MGKNASGKRCGDSIEKLDNSKNLELKTRKLNPVTNNPVSNNKGSSYIQILGNGMDTQDTCPSVLLFFDDQRFIFNVGEGLQRYYTENKMKLSTIDHVFLSRVCSETAGGLPGVLLTMAGLGDDGMCINMWGPPGFNLLVNAMKTFIPSAALVHAKTFGLTREVDGTILPHPKNFLGPFDLIDDEIVKISAFLLFSNENNGQVYQRAYSEVNTSMKTCDISVIYVCELPKVQGKFRPEKAKLLGLKQGPKYRDLQNGISVKSDTLDIMVHPSDVIDVPGLGPVVLIVDCPTTSHLQSILSADILSIYYTDHSANVPEISKEVNCVIHLTPPSVSNNLCYQNWMKRFNKAQHIMAGHERKNAEIPVIKGSAMMSARLNYLCPRFFPALGFWSPHVVSDSLYSNSSIEAAQAAIPAKNLLKFNLRPLAKFGLDESSIDTPTGPAETLDELRSEIPEIVHAVQQVRQLWDHPMNVNNDASLQNIVDKPWSDELGVPSCLENISREDMEIVLLGTGASQPSKYRNVSSIFINLFSKGGLLLDCGEGTLSQLKRRFGVEGADDVVRSLSCIWISHMHADHHTGLSRILAVRHTLLKDVPHKPLLVIGPGQLLRFLNEYQRFEELDMHFLDCKFTTRTYFNSLGESNSLSDMLLPCNGAVIESLNMLKTVLRKAGVETLNSFLVDHCEQSYGVSLTAAERADSVGEIMPGWKIVYSGDTRPCPKLVEEAQGATLLIHEATFEDSMLGQAKIKNHSTITEAIEVGKKAGVYRIILTHFSQRYPKIPVLGDTCMNNACVGFDTMSVNVADLPVLPQVLPYLRLLFKNEKGVEADESEANESEVDELRLVEVTSAL